MSERQESDRALFFSVSSLKFCNISKEKGQKHISDHIFKDQLSIFSNNSFFLREGIFK